MARPAAIMLQGTGSNVGKSLLTAGLCRWFTRQGMQVRPFKPQNMSNNAAVTEDGGEIGRAQALQARAARAPLSVHMNPVLLKPETETGAQVVVQGQILTRCHARDYQTLKPTLMPKVLQSFERLAAEADLLIVEGAGSPAEVNLRAGDLANMGFAEAANLPVVLVGDIERGGVIASLIGTHALLDPKEKARLQGYIVNKFRGDPALFTQAHPVIEGRTGMQSLGVVPWFPSAARLPAEDIMDLGFSSGWKKDGRIKIAVPRLPRIANFDDLDPLAAEADVDIALISPDQPLPADADLVILLGSKATLFDLETLKRSGLDIDLQAHRRRGGRILGICAGFQMLGHDLADLDGVEGSARRMKGLGLLDIDTRLTTKKQLCEITGRDLAFGQPIQGYEMHVGRTGGVGLERPMLDLNGRFDGAISANGRVMGCYVHGLFASDAFRHAFLSALRARPASTFCYEQSIEDALDALSDHLAATLDMDAMWRIASAAGAHGRRPLVSRADRDR